MYIDGIGRFDIKIESSKDDPIAKAIERDIGRSDIVAILYQDDTCPRLYIVDTHKIEVICTYNVTLSDEELAIIKYN